MGSRKNAMQKKNSSEKNKKVFWVAVAAEPVQGGLAHGEN